MENNPKCLYLLYIPCLHKNACPSLAVETRNNLSFPTSPWLPGCWGLFPLCISHRVCWPSVLLANSVSALFLLCPALTDTKACHTEVVEGWTPLHIRLLPLFLLQSSRLNSYFHLLLPPLLPSEASERGRGHTTPLSYHIGRAPDSTPNSAQRGKWREKEEGNGSWKQRKEKKE